MIWEFMVDMIIIVMREFNENLEIFEGFKVLFNLFFFDFICEGCLDLDFVLDMNVKNFKLVLEIIEDE